MKVLKIVGLAVLGVWMIWVTFQLNRLYDLEIETCGIAFGKEPDGRLRMPFACPATGYGIPKKEYSNSDTRRNELGH